MATDGEGAAIPSSWIFWAMANVFGGLRSVVDLVWQWGQVPFRIFPMDTLSTLLLGWLVFGVFMVALAKFLCNKFLSGDQGEEDFDSSHQEGEDGGPKLPAEGCKGPPPPPSVVTKAATIVPKALPEHVPAPIATGGDPDAVRWVNNLLVWFFEGFEGGPIVREAWNDNLNEYTVGVALEAGVLIEILEFLPQTTAPSFSNIIVDCSPMDDITVTCDMTITLYMRVQTTRTQRDVTTESEYACAVRPLRGRLNIALKTQKCIAFAKLDGWPEVNMELEGVRNNSGGLDEAQLQEVVKEELTASLRKVTLKLDFSLRKTFPRFSRQRTLPDHVMPVGYDALVRERQTFPPSFETRIPASRTPIPPRAKTKAQHPKPVVATITHTRDGHVLTPPPVPERVRELQATPKEDLLTLHEGEAASLLTVSEESLVRRNLEQYREDLAREEGIIQNATSVQEGTSPPPPPPPPPPITEIQSPPTTSPSMPRCTPESFTSHAPINRASMVFSSREKPIDEPNGRLSPGRNMEEEEEEEELFLQEMKARDKNPHAIPVPPPRSPTRDFESLKESLKETIRNNPFSRHLPSSVASGGGGGGSGGGSGSLFATSQSSQSNAPPVGIVGLNGKRLLVKVVKATGVGGDAGVSSCYTVVEMDEPPQKFSTNVINDTSSPFWDEQFLFDLSDNTLELLFELYNKGDNRFVGLGIVGIEELVATPSQRQIIPLQARPYEKDQVSGSLTCEFLFLDRADLPDLTLRKTVTGQTTSGKVKTTTTTTYVKPPTEEKQMEEEAGVSTTTGVAEAALKDLEGRQPNTQAAPNTRSTLIIHASKKVTRTPSGEYAELANGMQPLEEPRNEEDSKYYKPGVSISYGTGMGPQKGPITPLKSTGIVTAVPLPVTVTPAPVVAQHAVIESADPSPVSNGLDAEERGRSRSRRKRDFFGSLRRRFSRSKVRSQSVDPTASVVVDNVGASPLDADALVGRSISVERSTSVARSRGKSAVSSPTSPESQTQRFLTVPIARGRSTPSGGIGSGDSGSTRSSLSGTSGLSSASTKTYINEASLLVVETLENGVIKHYLVPLSLQRKNKWRKKGTKLHIFNEHTFVAKHLSSSITCQVCQKGIGRRLGKQGYECRDCSFKCHKPCHVKTDVVCPNSTVNSMDLVYVKDEKAERKKRLSS